MSGIAGCFFFDNQGETLLNRNISTMLNALIVSNDSYVQYYCNSDYFSFGICNSNNINTGQLIEDANHVACFNGNLTNNKELAHLAGIHTHDTQTLEACIILKLFENHKDDIVNLLHGIYACAIWDKNKKQLNIITDRYGYEYIYYYKDSQKLLFASEIKSLLAILKSKPQVNIDTICDIYAYRTIFNTKTPFEGITLMPHAVSCTISKDQCNIKQYWDYPIYVDHYDDDEKKLLDKSKDLIQSSVDNAVHNYSNLGIMLSGGLDSRLLAAIARKNTPSLKAFTFFSAYVKSQENRIAEQIAKQLDIEFQYLNRSNTHSIDSIDKCITDTDGQWGFHDFLPFIQKIKSTYPNIALIQGYLMDTLFKSSWAYFPNQGYNAIPTIEKIVKRYSVMGDYVIDKIFLPEFATLLKQKKRETVEEAVMNFPSDKPTEVSLRFYCLNRGRRDLNLVFRASNRYLPIILPGTDYPLVDFAFQLPYRLRSNPDFYLKLICTWFPQIGKIPWDHTGKPLEKGIKRKNKRLNNLLLKTKYSIQRITKGKIDFLNSPISFNNRFRNDKNFQESIKNIIYDHNTLTRGFFNEKGIDTLVESQLSGKDWACAFEAIISVEMLFRKFIDRTI